MAAPAPPLSTAMNYPFASSPDVLRTHQKDVYVSTLLSTQTSNVLRSLVGARVAHRYSTTTAHLSELLYLCVTSLLGNRTLGEEYCDVIQVEDDSLRLAGLGRRLSYIISVVFAPWILDKTLPALRRKLRLKLEHNISRARSTFKTNIPTSLKVQEYILTHLDTLTSLFPIYALSLATFYFTGSYYHISKRLSGLRYIFTKQIAPTEQRVGYEVLGVLLILQMTVQLALHLRQNFFIISSHSSTEGDIPTSNISSTPPDHAPTSALLHSGVEVDVHHHHSNPDQVLLDIDLPHHLPRGLSTNTQTPVLESPRYDLKDPEIMAWIPEGQQRKCTLCLEPFKDPSVTTCGHVFCWTCIQDWIREKAECPLCRQAVLGQKVLPLR